MVGVDLFVEELATTGDERLEVRDLLLEREVVLVRSQLRVAFDDTEQVPDGRARRIRERRLIADGGIRRVLGAEARDLGQGLLLEPELRADSGDEVRERVVALLERDIDVRPGSLAATLEPDDVVVGALTVSSSSIAASRSSADIRAGSTSARAAKLEPVRD